jgi:hypothetical protein
MFIHTLASKVSPHRRLSPATHLSAKVKGRDTGIGLHGEMTWAWARVALGGCVNTLRCRVSTHFLLACQPWKWEGLRSAIWISLAAFYS